MRGHDDFPRILRFRVVVEGGQYEHKLTALTFSMGDYFHKKL